MLTYQNNKIEDTFLYKIKKVINDQKSRISWPEYFMTLAYTASIRSPCERLHVGSIIEKDNRIVSTGYNGFPAKSPHKSIIRNNHEQNTIHSEQNAIADAAKRGVPIDDATLYVTHYPCINCAKIIIAAGIKKIIYAEDYKNDPIVGELLINSKVEIIKFG